MKIAVIGGGILGLSASYYLAGKCDVYLFEKEKALGGLAGSFEYNGVFMEKYHHFVSQSDSYLIELLDELGLTDQLTWSDTKVGYFIDNKLVPFTRPLEILRFPGLSLFDKFRMGLSMYCLKFVKDWRKLEDMSVKEWLVKYQGGRTYERIWKHLMESKFSGYVDKTPMSWFWSRSRRRLANRRNEVSDERFGYMKSSFSVLIDGLERRLERRGVKIISNCEVSKIIRKGKTIEGVRILNGRSIKFDRIIVTIPLPGFLNIVQDLSEAYKARVSEIRYKSILNAVILTKQRLSDYFWLNFSGRGFPFPAVIEFGNLKPRSLMGGVNVIYLPNYLSRSHSLYRYSDIKIKNVYIDCLKKVYKKFREDEIKKFYIFRDDFADPLYSLNYSKKMPFFRTPIRNLFLCNTSQIYPETRSVNNSIKYGEKIAKIAFENNKI